MEIKLDNWQIEWLKKVNDKNICISSEGRRLGKSWLNSMIKEYLEKIEDKYKCKNCGHFIHLLVNETCEICGYGKLKLSEEQEKQFREMIEKTENETILKCVKCRERLRGMKQVRLHVDKYQHHEYQKPGSKMRLLIG